MRPEKATESRYVESRANRVQRSVFSCVLNHKLTQRPEKATESRCVEFRVNRTQQSVFCCVLLQWIFDLNLLMNKATTPAEQQRPGMSILVQIEFDVPDSLVPLAANR